MSKYQVGKCLLPGLLKQRRMTQQELAIKANKTKQAISFYCNNKMIMSFETALVISRVLDCNMEDLYEIRVLEG